MKLTSVFVRAVSALVLVFLAAGCDYKSRDVPPASLEIGNGIGEMYLRSGVATEIVKRDVLGKHYQPGRDIWSVIACTEFTLADGGNSRDCNDSFDLYKLDSGKWMISGTVNGGYLWVEIL